MRITSWNIARRDEPWRTLVTDDAEIALLQEAAAPPKDVADQVSVESTPWLTEGRDATRPWRTSVVGISGAANLDRIECKALHLANKDELGVSRPGTIAAAVVRPPKIEPLTIVSAYALWSKPIERVDSAWIFADASAHRLVSDIASLVGRQSGHRILVAGDFNSLHGYGEGGRPGEAEADHSRRPAGCAAGAASRTSGCEGRFVTQRLLLMLDTT